MFATFPDLVYPPAQLDVLKAVEGAKKAKEESAASAAAQGHNAATVYRDRRGRKLDMLNEFMRTPVFVSCLSVLTF